MLTDVYTAGGEVLMGTLRWEKEVEEKGKQNQRRADFEHRKRDLQFAEADTRARITALEVDLQRKRAELALYSRDDEAQSRSSTERDGDLRRRRGADPVAPRGNGKGRLVPDRSAGAVSRNSGRKKTRKEGWDAP